MPWQQWHCIHYLLVAHKDEKWVETKMKCHLFSCCQIEHVYNLLYCGLFGWLSPSPILVVLCDIFPLPFYTRIHLEMALNFLSSTIKFNAFNSFSFMLWHYSSSSTFGILVIKLSICIGWSYSEVAPKFWLCSLWYVYNAKLIIPYAFDQGTQAHVKYNNPKPLSTFKTRNWNFMHFNIMQRFTYNVFP